MKNIDAYVDGFKRKHEAFILGCDAIEEMGLWNKGQLGEMDAFYTNDMTGIIIRLIAADGRITNKEVEYLNKTFGFDYTLEELKTVYENAGDCLEESFDESFANGITYMRRIAPLLADAYKELLSMICEIIINSDGVAAEAELAQAARLMAMCK